MNFPILRRVGAFALFLYLISGWVPVFAYSGSNPDVRALIFCGVGLVIGVCLFFWGFQELRIKRLMQDIPLSTIRAMAPGMVEVSGSAVNWSPFQGPLTQEECVYYQYQIEQLVSSGKSSHWETILEGDSSKYPFYIQDETGMVMVAPEGSNVIIPDDYSLETGLFTDVPPHISDFMGQHGISCEGFFGFEKKLRFTEYHLAPDEKIFVMGTCEEALHPPPGPPEGALAHICLGKGQRSGDVFILSDQSQKELESSYTAHAFGGIFGGLALIGGCLYGLLTLLRL